MAKKQQDQQAPPLGYGGNAVTVPGQQTVRPGGSQTFPTRPALPPKPRNQAKPAGRRITIQETQPGSLETFTDTHEPMNVPVGPSRGVAPQTTPYTPGSQMTVVPQQTPSVGQATMQPPAVQPIGQATPSQAAPPASPIVGTPQGSMYRGAAGYEMPFTVDPVTNATIPVPGGMTEAEWNANLDDDATYAIDEMLTTVDGPIGDSFRNLQKRREAVVTAGNLSQRQKDDELARIDSEWARNRYGALRDAGDTLHRRRRKARMDEMAAADADKSAAKAALAAEKEMEGLRDIAEQELSMPGYIPSQQEIEAHARRLKSGANPPMPRAMIAPSDQGNYAFDQSTGSYSLVMPDRTVPAAVSPSGYLVAAPRSADEFEALPDGTMYLTTTRSGARVSKMKGKPPEPLPMAEAVSASIAPRAEKAAKERADQYEAFQKSEAAYARKLAVHQAKRKAADAKGEDMVLWDEENLPPEIPEPPRALREAMQRAQAAGVPFDPAAVTEDDRRLAENEYWAGKGVAAADVPVLRGLERLAGWRRVATANGVVQAESPTLGIPVTLQRASVGGRQVMLPKPGTALEAAEVVRSGLPTIGATRIVTIDPTRHKGGDIASTVAAVDEAFPNLPEADRNDLVKRLHKGTL